MCKRIDTTRHDLLLHPKSSVFFPTQLKAIHSYVTDLLCFFDGQFLDQSDRRFYAESKIIEFQRDEKLKCQ